MTLYNRNVLITGASRGLGMSLAKEYAKVGCNLFLVGRNTEKLNDLKNSMAKVYQNTEIETIVCDLSNIDSIMKMINEVKDCDIDVLVNCAGVFPVNKLSETTIQEYQECIDINLTAPFVLTKELSKGMVKNKWGRIINIASSSAYGGSPMTSVYCASKHALLGLSRSLYKELKGDNVRVICVSPGSIKTEMGRKVEELGQDFDTFMEPDELAEYIVYSSSLDGNMISEEIRLNRVFVQ